MELDVVTLTLNPALDATAEVEVLVPYRKLRAQLVAREPGGGGVNVARVLHRFGVGVRAVFPAGGLAGASLVAALAREGVPTEAIRSASETRESITIWARSTGEHYRIVVAGEPLAEETWRACVDAVRRGPRARFVVFSGSLPPGVPPSVVAEAAEAAREIGAGFACDSTGETLAAAVEAGADLVTPNRRELCELVGRGVLDGFDHESAARLLVERGAGAVVVTLGADGAFALDRDGTATTCLSPPLEVVSTVGAGDSLLAGVVVGLLKGDPLAEALRRGVATGAATCLQHGSEVAHPEAVEPFLRRVK